MSNFYEIPDPRNTPTLSVPITAKILGVSKAHLYRHLDDIPVLEIGGVKRVITADLREKVGLPRIPLEDAF